MFKLFLGVIFIALLSGCASSGDYVRYAIAQENIAAHESKARIAEANAIRAIGVSGDEAAKVAAVMALKFSQSQNSRQAAMKEPDSILKTLAPYAPTVVQALVQGYSAHQQMLVNIKQADDAVLTNAATMGAFTNIASFNKPAIIPPANITTNTTLSGSGVIGDGSFSTQANPITTTNTTDSHNSNMNNPVTTNPITGK